MSNHKASTPSPLTPTLAIPNSTHGTPSPPSADSFPKLDELAPESALRCFTRRASTASIAYPAALEERARDEVAGVGIAMRNATLASAASGGAGADAGVVELREIGCDCDVGTVCDCDCEGDCGGVWRGDATSGTPLGAEVDAGTVIVCDMLIGSSLAACCDRVRHGSDSGNAWVGNVERNRDAKRAVLDICGDVPGDDGSGESGDEVEEGVYLMSETDTG